MDGLMDVNIFQGRGKMIGLRNKWLRGAFVGGCRRSGHPLFQGITGNR